MLLVQKALVLAVYGLVTLNQKKKKKKKKKIRGFHYVWLRKRVVNYKCINNIETTKVI
jgi:hypothetical protein